MPKTTHSLSDNKKWIFKKPTLGFKAHFTGVSRETGERIPMSLLTSSGCRESLIHNLREGLRLKLTNTREANKFDRDGDWIGKKVGAPLWIPTFDCDLQDPQGKKSPTLLQLKWHKAWMPGNEEFPIETFLKVCDTVLGPIVVLLGPDRPKGDWWKTDPRTALDNEMVSWKGSDNWFLAHPATVAIATGLYRQCFQLCMAGVADQILDSLSEGEVEELMSKNSQALALRAIKKTRDWIEVPVPKSGGSRENFAFPLGFWRRLIRLQRGIRRRGYERTLGQSFHEGWNTTDDNSSFSGLHNFWGEEGKLTNHHKHLMRAGAPRRSQIGKASKTSS